MPVIHIDTQEQFDDLIEENEYVVVDFFATWCGPCKTVAPEYEELSDEYDNIVFLKVDVDDHGTLSAYYGVSAMPTFVFIKNGEKDGESVGGDLDGVRNLIANL